MTPLTLALLAAALWVLAVVVLMAANHAAHRGTYPTNPARDRRTETVSCPNF